VTTLTAVITVSFGPSRPVIEELQLAANRHKGGTVRVAVAWARDEGAGWFLDALHPLARIQVVVGMNERGTTVEALLRLLPAVETLCVFFKHPRQTFHPKLYWFESPPDGEWNSATVIIGSSNLTRGGLFTNFESSLVAVVDRTDASTEEMALMASVKDEWHSYVDSPYAHSVVNEDSIRSLFEDGYLSSEAVLRRERRHAGRQETARAGLPTAPPPRIAASPFASVEVPFPVQPPKPAPVPQPEDVDLPGEPPLPDRFFVRTLTENDVRKLVGNATGTFEPDIGEIARDRYPAFWGWPDNYSEITRTLPRDEWAARGRLFSAASVAGVDVEVMLWYRPERPGHAAEHRVRLGPIPVVRAATPPSFSENSLVVFERAASTSVYDFIVRLLTANDPGYDDYAAYLSEERPRHRFGYGP
jgi:HKD family nuclease